MWNAALVMPSARTRPKAQMTFCALPTNTCRANAPDWQSSWSKLCAMPLSTRDAYRLIHSSGSDLESLFEAAGALRDEYKGRTVTYSRKIFLPITNLCRDRCSYCTFRKDPGDPDAWTMSPAEIDDVLVRGSQRRCKEALMCRGDKPEAAFPQYRETLAQLGHRTTTDYVRRACEMALEHDF